ncbi:hypothetical protein LSTR_LSTR012558 [Laodelphax striatellus]|uniref:Uncharacterized protein n=1 Tax=Laodelphax striatellus TaxID=195883 RepID=A0A482XCE1_LAOST|nr:hypothetical protein LSTR_LSTR012558 [Laodelphax striatellus]
MPPKKREKETDNTKTSRNDQTPGDHELFLQAFEKPTQIYRFLRTRGQLSPVYLNRTLSYMRHRMSRNHKSRKDFKVDKILDKVLAKNRANADPSVSGYLTLTFLGFYDKKRDVDNGPVKVETLLLKICHKKRKDVSCPVRTVTYGTSYVPYNPSDESPPLKVPAVSIPTDSFSLSYGHLVKSYHLLLRVGGSLSLNILTPNCDLDSEPALKKKKLNNGNKAVGMGVGGEEGVSEHHYGADLIIYDKHKRCLLHNGEYELLLEDITTQANNKVSHSLTSWEFLNTIREEQGDHLASFEKFTTGPTLKFRLTWSREPTLNIVDRPPPGPDGLVPPLPEPIDSNKENNKPGKQKKNEEMPVANNATKLQIVYQFLYNNNSRQQTEACEDLHCPWCLLDCQSLYPLLKHLKLCHSRFTFTYVPIPQGARIDVAINEHYDGSYCGAPQDLISQPPGMAFSRRGPVRRTTVSNILVCHPKRPRPSLSEFLELDENEFDGQRPYITGHNRLYHHTTTCLPIYPKEMDVDSEDENDPKWLQKKTQMMIDDFTDVNEGEKELMKKWNLHVMKHGFVGDCQIPLASTMFLKDRGHELLMKNLYRNFVLHMCNLFDFGLVSPVTVYTVVQNLRDMLGTEQGADASKLLQDSWQAQRHHWMLEGGANRGRQVASDNRQRRMKYGAGMRNMSPKPERSDRDNLNPSKKKSLSNGDVVSPRTQTNATGNGGSGRVQTPLIGKDAPAAGSGVKLRRKSSSSETAGIANAIQQRRKSYAGSPTKRTATTLAASNQDSSSTSSRTSIS